MLTWVVGLLGLAGVCSLCCPSVAGNTPANRPCVVCCEHHVLSIPTHTCCVLSSRLKMRSFPGKIGFLPQRASFFACHVQELVCPPNHIDSADCKLNSGFCFRECLCAAVSPDLSGLYFWCLRPPLPPALHTYECCCIACPPAAFRCAQNGCRMVQWGTAGPLLCESRDLP